MTQITHIVLIQDGFRVPARSLDEAVEIAARFAARGIGATVKLA